MANRRRSDPKIRREEILDAAISEAKKIGYQNLTRDSIATRANVSTGLVSHYFNTMTQLKRAVMRAAVARKELKIIAEGLSIRDPSAIKAPQELKKQAVALMIGG